MKPLIGITTSDTLKDRHEGIKKTYIDGVKKAGGIPVLLPVVEGDHNRYIDFLDGIVFTGGVDVAPIIYGEEPIPGLDYVSIERDRSELEFFKKAYERKLPILGICRGLQLINIGLGGKLYQDLESQVDKVLGHSPKQGSRNIHHSIRLEESSLIMEALAEELVYVNSYHHQAIKFLGKNLRVSSRAQDGIIESIEATDDRFLLGLQFHPEELLGDYPKFLNIFRMLVEAAMEEA